MKKKKVLTIIITIIFIILLITTIYFIAKNDTTKQINKAEIVCQKINNSKKNNETFILVLKSKFNLNGESKDAIKNFKKKYKDLIVIHEINYDLINNKCFEKALADTGTYEVIKQDNSAISIYGYKDGIYQGMIQNETSEYGIEKYLVETKIITKKDIKEEITYEEYLKNKEKDEYLLLVMSEENAKKEVLSNMQKVFTDIPKNTINKRSSVGEKIVKNIEENFVPKNVYPQVFYFKNGKIIASESVFGENKFKEFKETIDKLNN